MKRLIGLVLAFSLIILSNSYVFAEDSFVVSLQTAKTLTYDSSNNNYYQTADVIETDKDFYLFFTIDEPKDLYAYKFRLYYDKSLVELVKDNGSGVLTPIADGGAPVSFNTLFNFSSGQVQEGNNICTTSADGRGEVNYFVTLMGSNTVFPAKITEYPYRLAYMHFRVKPTDGQDHQALFSLETDRYKDEVVLYNNAGRVFAKSVTATKIINIHDVLPTVPLPPVATYNYNTTDNKWYLTLTKEDDTTVEIHYKTALNGGDNIYEKPISLDATTIVYSYTRRTRGTTTADSTTITFSTPTVAAYPPPGGYDTDPGNISLSSVPGGYDVYYTTDDSIGEPPNIATLTKYDSASPVKFQSDKNSLAIKTILGKNGVLFGNSFKILNYSIRPNAPVANPIGGSFTSSVAVRFIESEQTTKDCTIYYTLDGSEPTTASTQYNGPSPINITSTSTLKAIAVKDGKTSLTSQFVYTIVPPSSGGGGGGTTTVYKYVSIEKIISELKYKVVDGKAVYEIPNIEGELPGDYVITTDATQDDIEIKFTLQHIIDGAKGLKKIIINTKNDSFILPFYNIDYPLAVEACKGIKPIDVPVTLIYSRKVDDSPLIVNANLTKDSKFYSYTLTSYIDKVAFPMRYLVGYAQYIVPSPEVPSDKTLLGVAMNGNIIQTPLFFDKTTTGKESVVLRTLSDHPVCMVYGDKRTYSDIDGNWTQNNIERLATLRIVNGRPEGFTPETFITRAELAAMISRALGAVMKDTVATPFSDLDKTHWSYYEANNAKNWNLIHGYPDSTFKPEQQVTRLETIQMIANALSYTNRDAVVNTTEAGKYLLNITDSKDIESWAVPSVVMALKYGIIKGYEDGSIRPNSPITRAEAATLIGRLLVNFNLIN